jgi:flavin reductase (DIM6/NTAB) family NADH-FMN oxidoreductase RutF
VINRLMTALDYPMLIVTAAAGDEADGCLVGFATQTSIHPVRFLVCISRRNHTHGIAVRARALAVHVLCEDDMALAELFGGETADEVDKLARCRWRSGPGGAPILEGCPNWFAGPVVARFDAGDHEGFLIDPVDVEFGGLERQLGFQRARRIEPGHEP